MLAFCFRQGELLSTSVFSARRTKLSFSSDNLAGSTEVWVIVVIDVTANGSESNHDFAVISNEFAK